MSLKLKKDDTRNFPCKIITIFLVLIIVLTVCSCKNNDIEQNGKSSTTAEQTWENTATAETTDGIATTVETTFTQDDISESLSDKLIREIDGAYKVEQSLPENSTTIGIVEHSKRYAEKWEDVADEYYSKIMEYDEIIEVGSIGYSSDDLHIFVTEMKNSREQYHKTQVENYGKILRSIYAHGTIVGPILADYEYELQKEWALQLVEIYEQLC